jgi:hypothetical protein
MPTWRKPATADPTAPTAFGPTAAAAAAMFTLGRGWCGLPGHAAHGQDGRKKKVNHAAGAA